MFATTKLGRLSVTVDTRDQQEWWPPLYFGKYAHWFSLGPWVTLCWERRG